MNDSAKLLLLAALFFGVASATEHDRYAPVPSLPEHFAVAQKLARVSQAKIVKLRNTRSMEPTLDAEDLLIMRAVPPEELRVGDIIGSMRVPETLSFQPKVNKAELVIHRIVRTRSRKLITKGDSVRDREETYAKDIQGRIEFVIDGQTGVIRDMRGDRQGEVVNLDEALARLGVVSVDAVLAENQDRRSQSLQFLCC